MTLTQEMRIIIGDAAEAVQNIEPESVDLIVTSPPYYRRIDYGADGQYGLEETAAMYIDVQCIVAARLLKTLKPTGIMFWVIQDSFNGSGSPGNDYKNTEQYNALRGPRETHRPYQSQLLIPERTRLRFASIGWVPRMSIIWNKAQGRNWGPRRPSYSHEYIYLFSKNIPHYWAPKAVTGPKGGRLGSVWDIPPAKQPVVTLPDGRTISGRASFPLELARRCVLLGSPPGGLVIDPYCGLGTTGVAAIQNDRGFVGTDINSDFVEAARIRINTQKPAEHRGAGQGQT